MIYAIPYMLISILSITFSTFFAKMLINNNYSASLIELYRFLIPLFFTLPFLYKNYVFKLNLASSISILLRGFFLSLSQYFLFISMKKISLYEAVILYNMCPFYIYIYDVMLIYNYNYISTYAQPWPRLPFLVSQDLVNDP